MSVARTATLWAERVEKLGRDFNIGGDALKAALTPHQLERAVGSLRWLADELCEEWDDRTRQANNFDLPGGL